MQKHQTYQKFIYKIHSKRILQQPQKHLNLSLQEARENDEIISLADSTILRFIDQINGLESEEIEQKIKSIRRSINSIKQKPKSAENKKAIHQYYAALDKLQFKPEYVSIIIDKTSDFFELNKGFYINGLKYLRFVGTPNGLKKQTVVYVCEENESGAMIHQELRQRLNNGRNTNVPLVPAKYEAYQALACSSSTPLTLPKGILVVDDLILHFTDHVISLNDEDSDEPIMIETDEEVEANNSDGYGLMSPELAQIWSDDLKEPYLIPGGCIRNSFIKGMVYTFDFHEFANEFSKSKIVKDVWGIERCIDDIDLILTTSMFKLWDSYDSLESYLENCKNNRYSFSMTKPCVEELESERKLNYQFIQSYDLTDEEIDQLITPTVNDLKDIIERDKNKTILFMKGTKLREDNVQYVEDDFVKQIMIDDRMMKDPHVIDRINYTVKKKIDDAKKGDLKIHGNYAQVSGDPFALCQKIFNTETPDEQKGLLKAGEIYSQYWADRNVEYIACFRQPMSVMNNIRKLKVVDNPDVRKWYKYMTTVNILNCHDTTCAAMNGCDMDGDAFITTDNPILVNNTENSPTIVCVQKKALKEIITEESLARSNTQSFGSDIGAITNRVTSMYEVMAQFDKNSIEYQMLDYRTKCGELLQQNSIDRTKGVVAKPMPENWYLTQSVINMGERTSEDKAKKELYAKIVANKKPYFMNYVYIEQRNQYNTYIKTSNMKCQILYGMSVQELAAKPNKSTEEADFLYWYNEQMPVGLNPCVMNKVAWKVEEAFAGYTTEVKHEASFDYTIMKSDQEYASTDMQAIKKLYKEYQYNVQNYSHQVKKYRIDNDEASLQKDLMRQKFKMQCEMICPNSKQLCNILLDLCYTSSNSKQFAWDMCQSQIIENLLNNNNRRITYLTRDDNGEVEYCGEYYTIKEAKI